jgi:hypothetical protein
MAELSVLLVEEPTVTLAQIGGDRIDSLNPLFPYRIFGKEIPLGYDFQTRSPISIASW